MLVVTASRRFRLLTGDGSVGAMAVRGCLRWRVRAGGRRPPRSGNTALQRLFALRLELQPRVVGLLLLLEFLQPLLARVLWREAPLLTVIVPVVRVQRLRALEVFRGELGVARLLKPDGE